MHTLCQINIVNLYQYLDAFLIFWSTGKFFRAGSLVIVKKADTEYLEM
jgi:hypothetical protein